MYMPSSSINACSKAKWVVPFVEYAHDVEAHEAWIFVVAASQVQDCFVGFRLGLSGCEDLSQVLFGCYHWLGAWSCVMAGHCGMPSSMVDELLSPFGVLALSDPLGLISVPKAWAGIQQLSRKVFCI